MRRRWWRLRTKPPPTSGAKVCTRPGHIVDTEANPAHVRHRGSPFTKVDARVSRGFGHGGAGAFLPVGPTPPCRTGPEADQAVGQTGGPRRGGRLPRPPRGSCFGAHRTQRRRENHAAAIDGRRSPASGRRNHESLRRLQLDARGGLAHLCGPHAGTGTVAGSVHGGGGPDTAGRHARYISQKHRTFACAGWLENPARRAA